MPGALVTHPAANRQLTFRLKFDCGRPHSRWGLPAWPNFGKTWQGSCLPGCVNTGTRRLRGWPKPARQTSPGPCGQAPGPRGVLPGGASRRRGAVPPPRRDPQPGGVEGAEGPRQRGPAWVACDCLPVCRLSPPGPPFIEAKQSNASCGYLTQTSQHSALVHSKARDLC